MAIRGTNDPYSGSAPPLDKRIGNAYALLQKVVDNLDVIKYAAHIIDALAASAHLEYSELSVELQQLRDQLAGIITGTTPLPGDGAEIPDSIFAHLANKNNPHSTTAAQVGALPLAGGNATGIVTLRGAGSMAELRTRSIEGLVNGSTIALLGYYAPADTGGGTFVWDAYSAQADDQGTVIKPAGAGDLGRWRRVYSGGSNVRWFGAKANNLSDDVTAFELAAIAHIDVTVPLGAYRLARPVNTNGQQVNWILEEGTVIVGGTALLRGTISRGRRRNKAHTYGTWDQATADGIMVGGDPDRMSSVLGFLQDADMADYPERDSVALYADNIAMPPVHRATGTTYTANTVTYTNPADTTLFKVGMIIDTEHTPKFSGRIITWVGNTITVGGWFRTGNRAPNQVPQSGVAALVGITTSIWSMNGNVMLYPDAPAENAHAIELGVFNYKRPFDPISQFPRMTGSDVVSGGTYGGFVGHYSRGSFWDGFRSQGAIRAAFMVENYAPTPTEFGLLIERACTPIEYRPDGFPTFRVDPNGSIEMGRRNLATTPFIDMHSSGKNNDYDVRLIAQGGADGLPGLGNLVVSAGNLVSPNIIPEIDGLYSLGSSSARYVNVHTQVVRSDSAVTGYLALGSSDVASRALDFKTSGGSSPFDVRLLAVGGSPSTPGLGSLFINSGTTYVTNLMPGSADIYALGSATTPFFAMTATNLQVLNRALIGRAEGGGPVMDFRSAPGNQVFDARIAVDGGIPGQNGRGVMHLTCDVVATQILLPAVDNGYSCGGADFRWNQVYSTTGVINTSDEREKREIQDIPLELAESLVLGIKAKTFRWEDRVRRHTGFIAQQVEEAVNAAGVTNEDFAGLIISEDGRYGLRQDQLYALLWPFSQGLHAKMLQLEARVAELEAAKGGTVA